jgi:Na+/proline symporter
VIFPPQETLSLAEYVADREFTFVRGIAEVLPPGIKGLMLTGMLAALASTLDTHLNWGASYWTNDIFKRFLSKPLLGREANPRELVWVARAANLLILTIALLILPGLSSLQKAWQISLMLGSGMGVILVLRWMWWRINAWGELACIGTSLFLAPVLLYFVADEFEAVRLLCMAIGSTAVGILVSWVTGPGEREHLVRFYRRVRPPGFWGPISRLVDEPRQDSLIRLKYGAFKTVTASFSIFCLLTGIGTALVGGSPPSWFPWRTPWVLLLMGLGVIFSPSWWRTRERT